MSIDDDLKYQPKHSHCETLVELDFYLSPRDIQMAEPVYLPAGTEILYTDPPCIWQTTKTSPIYYLFTPYNLEGVTWRKVY